MISAIAGFFETIFTIIGVLITIVGFLITVAIFIFEGTCLFRMATKMGCENRWFAFSPILRKFLEFQIPPGDFNLWNIIVVKNKKIVAIVCIVVAFVVTPIVSLLVDIPYVGVFFWSFEILLTVFVLIERWKRMYDIMKTFGVKKTLIFLSIVCTIIPIVYTVVLAIISNNEPDKGEYGSFKEIEA